jgi:hypothetical protein
MMHSRRDFGKLIPPARGGAATNSKFGGVQIGTITYIKEHHARVTNLHLKNRKREHGANKPWGEGDTPITDVLAAQERKVSDPRQHRNISMAGRAWIRSGKSAVPVILPRCSGVSKLHRRRKCEPENM